MKINVKTTGVEFTEALSDYVDDKVGQIEKFIDVNDESVICDVEVGVITKHHQSGEIFRAEINMHMPGKDLRAESEKEDLYLAINDAKEDMIQSVKAHKDKQQTLTRKGGGILKRILKGFEK